MIIALKNAQCIDGVSEERFQDLYLVDGTIQSRVPPGASIDRVFDLRHSIIMPGGVDMHTHIGGGKVNLARLLLPDLAIERAAHRQSNPWYRDLRSPVPSTVETGLRYLQMGYTTCMEPAILPANARAAHCEMADIPWLDTGGYLLLGSERMLLEMLSQVAPQEVITTYIGTMLKLHQCCGVKVVNAGGIDAFKFNQRSFDVDTPHPVFGVTPRSILQHLARGVDELGIPHPLHVHCSNLGMPGNIASTLQTLEAVDGHRVHLTHAQYHSYGEDGPHGFSSKASVLADYVNAHPEVSIDVGQILFGQTVTISGDTMHQFDNRKFAKPPKTIFQDAECQAGCGIVPFQYRESQYVHGLQWTIGLELCLRVHNPMQVFLTTDHPNGGPFTAYPHLIRLLTSYDFRMSIFDRLHDEVKKTSNLPSLSREYSLGEIAQMTRSGPAKVLGLSDRGTLEDGKVADIVVYERAAQVDSMFANPTHVFRRGELVLESGEPIKLAEKQTIIASPDFDRHIGSVIESHWRRFYGYSVDMVRVHPEELIAGERSIWDTVSRNRILG